MTVLNTSAAVVLAGPVKVDLILFYGAFEWQETYYDMLGGGVNNQTTIVRARALAFRKNAMTGLGVGVRAVRLSNYLNTPVPVDASRVVRIVYKDDDSTTGWGGESGVPGAGAGNTDRFGDSPVLSLKAKLLLANGRSVVKYMGGVPDGVQVGPGLVDGAQNKSWKQAFDAFTGILEQTSYGIRSRVYGGSPRIPITALAQFPIGTNTWQVTTRIPHGFVTGQVVKLRGVKPNPAKPKSWNTFFKVSDVPTTTTFLVSQPVYVPTGWMWAGAGTAESVVYAAIGIVGTFIAGTTHRKRGNRGFGEPRGKVAR